MTVWYKQGVVIKLKPIAQKGFGRVAKLYAGRGLDVYVTSGCEANHSPGSFHYIDQAWDQRQLEVSVEDIKQALGPGWDVLVSNHGAVHIEYDPK